MAEVSRHLAFIKEDIPTLKIRLRRHKSFNIVIIDSFQYTQMTYRDYIQLKEEFPDKLFVSSAMPAARILKVMRPRA